eukprot:CAMPEP_0198261634 /NCGR_PEP_ID=MMETSP1447-20131203/10320_1 /TAXON_ID=420782 /ORGANISM="Chaetoceros dichaeta, Strain CCMP1751" /LENGTH=446 /DNA_ID=CAMNT_0043949615 /DNA_START=99 /DNA_END=1439 /DNA_ORIENTATION=+
MIGRTGISKPLFTGFLILLSFNFLILKELSSDTQWRNSKPNVVLANGEGRGDLNVTNDTNSRNPNITSVMTTAATATSVSGVLPSPPHGKNRGTEIDTTLAPNQTILQLWSGEAIRPFGKVSELSESGIDGSRISIARIKTIELVIAYCSANLTWIYEHVLQQISKEKGITVRMTILSKCGKDADLPQFINNPLVTNVDLIKLPNVGGCDYAYAHFINNYISKANPSEADSSLIIFMKDAERIKHLWELPPYKIAFRNVTEIMEVGLRGKFICGSKFLCNASPYHNINFLRRFIINYHVRASDRKKDIKKENGSDFNHYQYANIADFHKRALNWAYPNKKMTEVCYGGVFAVPASRILFLSNQPKEGRVLKLIEEHLTRNDTSIEEHFIERTWAGLLAQPLNGEEIALLFSMRNPIMPEFIPPSAGVTGALIGDISLTCPNIEVLF